MAFPRRRESLSRFKKGKNMNGHTHEFEPTFGFPESLPTSEKVLWQGSPCAWLIARESFSAPFFFYFLIFSCLALIFNSDVLTLKDLFVKFFLIFH